MEKIKIDFLYIGPPKSGSSWLYELLRAHPDIFVPAAKDIYFFDRYYNKGWSWYVKHFEKAGDRLKGEVCHDYLYSKEACERIKRHLPDVKLIVMLRHPVERAVSHYKYSTMQGNVTGDLNEAVRQNENILECSRYSKYLPMYIETFGVGNVLILDFDQLKKDPDSLVKQVCKFLGIEIDGVDFDVHNVVNKAMSPRSVWLSKTIRFITTQVRKLGFANLVGLVKRSGIKRMLYRKEIKKINLNEIDHSSLTSELEAEIDYWVSVLRKDVPGTAI